MRGGEVFKFLTKIRPRSPIKVSLEEGDVGKRRIYQLRKAYWGDEGTNLIELNFFLKKERNEVMQGLGRFCAPRRKASRLLPV